MQNEQALNRFIDQAIDRIRLRRNDDPHTLPDAAHMVVRWGQQDDAVRSALVSLVLPYVRARAAALGLEPIGREAIEPGSSAASAPNS